jgi:hypothetical protein
VSFALVWSTIANANDDSIEYSWHCAASGFYGTEVTPNGSVKPFADYSDKTPVQILVRDAGRDIRAACGWDDHRKRLYFELT